jgi:hypothetical protein
MEFFPNQWAVVGASADEVLVLAVLSWAGLDGACQLLLNLCLEECPLSLPTRADVQPTPPSLSVCMSFRVPSTLAFFLLAIITVLRVATRGSEKKGQCAIKQGI